LRWHNSFFLRNRILPRQILFNLNEKKMKKLIMILMAAAVMSCGDGNNNASENTDDTEAGSDRTELAEPDSTMMQSDTTSTGDMDQRQDDNDMDRGEAGTRGSDNSKNQRDTIQ
jgi:hypothetical protein